ncbi:hypothetical protein [Microbispora triticiradicis]|uniref:MFS transporter n=2 Tax=Microbispora TaxID=2005 RepID=A0ABY3LY72_9ACTN|nr:MULTISPECIES: hypothetical protein [Microbispora]TLP66175.1 hypothetical protein FED44_01250 [Microbispora fusca]TYB58419.1 hypothetical protein FXF59_16390 [Microbispora tritici]
MSKVRGIVLAVIVAAVVGPGVSLLLRVTGGLESAGVLTGLVAGGLLRGKPARAAVATLYGSASAVLIGEMLKDAFGGGPDFADAMAVRPGWPGWVIGAVLAYVIAARRLPRAQADQAAPAHPVTVPHADPAEVTRAHPTGIGGLPHADPGEAGHPMLAIVITAALAAVLACGQIVAGKALGMTLWEAYHEYDGPGWYRDLTHALWYPAASVVLASLVASRMPAGRGCFLVPPLAAWLGCAVTAGPLQYLQALGASYDPPAVALMASLAGGGVGAAAGAAALRHTGTRLGLVCFVLLFTAGDATHRLDDFPAGVFVSIALAAAVAAWVAARQDADVGSGVLAGMAGPLFVWSVYATIGSRLYDHSTQALPYWNAMLVALLAPAVALPAAALARLARLRTRARPHCDTAARPRLWSGPM